MGDFNINWEDKVNRRILKIVTDKYNFFFFYFILFNLYITRKKFH